MYTLDNFRLYVLISTVDYSVMFVGEGKGLKNIWGDNYSV